MIPPNLKTTGGAEGALLTKGANGIWSPTSAPSVTLEDATTNNVSRPLTLTHTTTGTAAAGIGAGILLRAESAAGTTRSAGAVDALHTTATDGAEVSALVLRAARAGTLLEGARVTAPASAVNSVELQGSAAASPVIVIARGSDTNISLSIRGKGTGGAEIGGASGRVGFYGTAPIAQQTGVAVTAGAIHAALVALGLITA
jgi:hypothetical protein